MTTKPEEIARVRYIHSRLDIAAAEHAAGRGYGAWNIQDDTGEIHKYTAEEVRRWPEMKAALVQECRRYPAYNAAWGRVGPSLFRVDHIGPGQGDACVAPSVARGLCLYREMLPADPAREERLGYERPQCRRCTVAEDGHYVVLDPSGHCGHCVADLMNAAREPAAKAPDQYEQHRNELVDRLRQENRWQPSTPLDVLTAASMRAEDNEPDLWAKAAGKGGRSARDRLVAALRAEQAWRERPDMLATFPKDGRNFALRDPK